MRQLSALDAQFLYVESATTAGHVGCLLVLDPSGGSGHDLSLDDVRIVLEPRLHLAEALRQRLVRVPLALGLPYWVDDPEFDIEFHLREVGLPRPGDDDQLSDQVARIHARPLDRTRPLWELYLIHNLAGGRQALYAKVHHSLIDGVSGAGLMAALLDVTEEPRIVDPPEELWDPPALPSSLDLFGRGLVGAVSQPLDTIRTLPRSLLHAADLPGLSHVPGVQVVGSVLDATARLATGGRVGHHAERRTLVAPQTPLNATITAHRRFAYGTLPLAEVKAVKAAYAMTVNDVVMALCATVLRRWLLDHDALPDVPLVAGVPVSIRGEEDPGGLLGNQVSMLLTELPTQVADAEQRLYAVREHLAEAKARFDTVPTQLLQDLSAAVPMALAGLAARAAFRMATVGGLPLNLFVSNVPGPRQPWYVGGARVEGVYPASAITDVTGALNITLFSYAGDLHFGLIACRELVPDVWNLIGYLRDALDELLALATPDSSG